MILLGFALSCGGTGAPKITPCTNARSCDAAGCWVALCGGVFARGSSDGEPDERPVHSVRVDPFEIMAHEALTGTWNACVAGGGCIEDPAWADDRLCTRGRKDLPITCIDWFQARDLCHFVGGRLPSEAEWEYAARGQGDDRTWPWGEAAPSCDRLVLDLKACDISGLQPACSTPKGNTPQGLCDVAGNAFEWCADRHHSSYAGAPIDGSARDGEGRFRVMRGGGIGSIEPPRTRNRVFHPPEFSYPGLGVRCVR